MGRWTEFTKANEEARKRFEALVAVGRPRKGLWLRQWRNDHALTQTEFGRLVGVSLRTVIRWEQREVLPRIVTLALEGR